MQKLQELFFLSIGLWLTVICTQFPAITYHLALGASLCFWIGAYVGSGSSRRRY